jgi:hypothetical protein
VTSFNDTTIQIRHSSPLVRRRYLPIHPADHPDTSDILTVAHGKLMKKLSYVNTGKVHQLPLSILCKYGGDDDFHLERESYQTLVRAIWKQALAEQTVRLLSSHGMEPPPVRHYQSAGGWMPVPATESISSQDDIPPSLVSTAPISMAYGTIPRSSMAATTPRRPAYNQSRYEPPTRPNLFAYGAHRRPTRHMHDDAHGGNPKRLTWLVYAIKITLFLVFQGACWYSVKKGIAVGRAVWEWLQTLPSTIGGACIRWWKDIMHRLGMRLEALLSS